MAHDSEFDRFRHEVRNKLAIIHGQTQLMRRVMQRPELRDGDLRRLLQGLDQIEVAGRAVLTRIEEIGSGSDGGKDRPG